VSYAITFKFGITLKSLELSSKLYNKLKFNIIILKKYNIIAAIINVIAEDILINENLPQNIYILNTKILIEPEI
jgi:hypothetical protein